MTGCRFRQRVTAGRGFAAMAVGLLAACSDGYPTEDEPPLDLPRMTQPQLLAAMNRLGAEKHLVARWRYVLKPDCLLEIRESNGDSTQRTVALEGASVQTQSEDKVIHILVRPNADPDSAAVLVLKSRRWSDSVRMQSLLAHLERTCSTPATA